MPTWLERQRKKSAARILKKEAEQHVEGQHITGALGALWRNPSFQVLITLLDKRFDPERYLISGDEYQRRMAADYWKLRREMEHKYANQDSSAEVIKAG